MALVLTTKQKIYDSGWKYGTPVPQWVCHCSDQMKQPEMDEPVVHDTGISGEGCGIWCIDCAGGSSPLVRGTLIALLSTTRLSPEAQQLIAVFMGEG